MARQKVAHQSKRPPEVRRALAFTGIFSRLALSEGVTVSHLLKVAKEERDSPHIVNAIVKEVRRIERTA